ncbi:MAG: metal-dependent transcriptional regulator [Euryarchaeota archaeon]|jgi:DtxR family transcriptional regulator, Mn-dependent transcriptional regulator|nr:metal-dependent transcriptional regulator [Euryarchaeota archaeon]
MSGHFQEFEDEYLETMYAFYETNPQSLVRTGDLASSLKVSPASATEMVQRLASKGFVNYIPYKGASLTESGLAMGQQMKRRHRLAEVLLDKLPFFGNVHQTACRLEHAIDDDLEVALTLLLDKPNIDPSGRDIPPAREELASRINQLASGMRPMSALPDNSEGDIRMMVLSESALTALNDLGVTIGTIVKKQDGRWQTSDGTHLQLSESIAEKILIRC